MGYLLVISVALLDHGIVIVLISVVVVGWMIYVLWCDHHHGMTCGCEIDANDLGGNYCI